MKRKHEQDISSRSKPRVDDNNNSTKVDNNNDAARASSSSVSAVQSAPIPNIGGAQGAQGSQVGNQRPVQQSLNPNPNIRGMAQFVDEYGYSTAPNYALTGTALTAHHPRGQSRAVRARSASATPGNRPSSEGYRLNPLEPIDYSQRRSSNEPNCNRVSVIQTVPSNLATGHRQQPDSVSLPSSIDVARFSRIQTGPTNMQAAGLANARPPQSDQMMGNSLGANPLSSGNSYLDSVYRDYDNLNQSSMMPSVRSGGSQNGSLDMVRASNVSVTLGALQVQIPNSSPIASLINHPRPPSGAGQLLIFPNSQLDCVAQRNNLPSPRAPMQPPQNSRYGIPSGNWQQRPSFNTLPGWNQMSNRFGPVRLPAPAPGVSYPPRVPLRAPMPQPRSSYHESSSGNRTAYFNNVMDETIRNGQVGLPGPTPGDSYSPARYAQSAQVPQPQSPFRPLFGYPAGSRMPSFNSHLNDGSGNGAARPLASGSANQAYPTMQPQSAQVPRSSHCGSSSGSRMPSGSSLRNEASGNEPEHPVLPSNLNPHTLEGLRTLLSKPKAPHGSGMPSNSEPLRAPYIPKQKRTAQSASGRQPKSSHNVSPSGNSKPSGSGLRSETNGNEPVRQRAPVHGVANPTLQVSSASGRQPKNSRNVAPSGSRMPSSNSLSNETNGNGPVRPIAPASGASALQIQRARVNQPLTASHLPSFNRFSHEEIPIRLVLLPAPDVSYPVRQEARVAVAGPPNQPPAINLGAVPHHHHHQANVQREPVAEVVPNNLVAAPTNEVRPAAPLPPKKRALLMYNIENRDN